VEGGVEIVEVGGDALPLDLLLLADPSPARIGAYLHGSRAFAARAGSDVAGACLVRRTAPDAWELENIAVRPALQRSGIGTRLLRHAMRAVGAAGAARLELGTGAFGAPLAFYQRHGFRVVAVERDYFLRHYPEPLFEDGIQHKDRLRLAYAYPPHGSDARAAAR